MNLKKIREKIKPRQPEEHPLYFEDETNSIQRETALAVIGEIGKIMEGCLIGIGTTSNQAHWYNDGIRTSWSKIKELKKEIEG